MRLVEIPLASATRRAIFDEFMVFARRGIDVQDFDPCGRNLGTKPSLLEQLGYYGTVDDRLLGHLGGVLRRILEGRAEGEALAWFEQVRRLPSADLSETDVIAPLQLVRMLPGALTGVEPEDLRSPNGLRVPESIRDRDGVREYSALLLLPKLVLAGVAGLCEMSPWLDPDMDLGSAVHTIRPDADKFADGSGYGAGNLVCHTDGYWAEEPSVPAWNVMLCATNPFDEPTNFIRVADLFRVLDERHPYYDRWAQGFSSLRRPDQSPREFVEWVLEEAAKPQFSFMMGSVGGGAARSVRNVPLLEKHSGLPGYLFRYKSTFSANGDYARPVVEFVNRMVKSLSDGAAEGLRHDLQLPPGSVVFSLNGCCLRVSDSGHCPVGGIAYPVSGGATIHGRRPLRIVENRVRRTIVRCNLVATPPRPSLSGAASPADEGRVAMLLRSGYRANQLQR